MDLRLSARPSLYPRHPMTPQRSTREQREQVDVRQLRQLRKDCNCPLPSGKSLTCSSLADWTEFDSLCSARELLRRHARSACSPKMKWLGSGPAVAS